jgi:serine/threonine-protein kinase
MATVHLGRLIGNKGFSRTVAIKQLHAQLVHDAEFAAMFLDEAHLTARIRHPNVVAPLDVVESEGEICIVMEYVHGESLGRLMQLSSTERIPERIVSAIMIQVLLGLHAAHVATDDHGQPLRIVHRDVSPQNILVGEDGITRVVDFGIAKAARRIHSTDGDKLKGKLGYMSPEQLRLGPIDHRSDLFAAGIILWELLTGRELFTSQEPAAAIEQMLRFQAQPPSSVVASIPPELDEIVLKALSVHPDQRYATARDMARVIESTCPPAGTLEVSEWVNRLAAAALERRAEWIADIEEMSLDDLTRTHAVNHSSSTPPAVEQPRGEPFADLLEEPKGEGTDSAAPAAPPRVASQSPSLVVTTSKTPSAFDRRGIWTSWRPRLIGLAGTAALVGAGLLLWRRVPARHPRVTVTALDPVTTEVVVSPPRQSAAPATPPVVQSANIAAPLSTLLDAPDASTSSAPHDVRTTVGNRAASATGRSAAPAPSAKSSAANCRIPYWIDAQGIKRFRLECFNRPE